MNTLYADIIVDISHEKLDRTFQYRVPESLRGRLEPGACVMIPFGNGNRLIKGYVVALGETCQFAPEKIKDIAGMPEKETGVEDKMIALAAWIRRNYGCTMIQALKTVLPAKQSVKKLEHRQLVRLMNREEILSLLGECERKKQVAKARLLKALSEQETIPYEWITGKLGVSAATVNSIVKSGAAKLVSSESYRNPVKMQSVEAVRNTLSEEQQTIVTEVLKDFDAGRRQTYLIHGITGSGKTEVYMRLIGEMIARGRQAIVLIPEIALTYQTLLRFYQRFGDRVSVMNSTLSPGEKYDQCERAKAGEIDVIIGPRSALFTPFPSLGLIVMDEEQENSYKSESTPKYHARETALEVAKLYGASVVLGSATPSLEAYYRAGRGEYRLFQLTKRLTGGELPTVYTVDLRQELQEGNRSIFSRKLQELMTDRLNKGQQTILFLNRRGYAGFVSCRSCGEVMKCPHCDVSLSEHKGGRLICHYCGYTQPMPKLCPKCGSKYILGFKAGTQQIEEKLKELYPGVRTLRMDADTTRTKDSYEKILSSFANGEADVLIFTPVTYNGSGYFSALILIHYSPGRIIRTMRTGKRHFQKQRPFRRITFYRLHRPVSCPYGRMQALGQSICFRSVGIPLHPCTVGIQAESLRIEPFTIITHKIRRLHTSAFIQNSHFESMQHILRMPMHLSYSQCMIAQVFQHLRHFIRIMLRHLSIS